MWFRVWWKSADKKNALIAILSLALLIVGWISFAGNVSPIDNTIIEKRLDSLTKENERYALEISSRDEKIKKFEEKISALENTKIKTEIRYVEKSKNIDNAYVNGLIDEFKIVFASSQIK